jgi:hypothetical protein
MKVRANQEVKVIQSSIIRVICDRCGCVIPPIGSDYAIREFCLMYAYGATYPEGGHSHVVEVEDLCDHCVESMFRLLRENGFAVTERDNDW